MKTLALAIVLLALAAHAAPNSMPWERDPSSPNPIDHYPDRDMPGHEPPDYGGFTILTCAPEVVEGNVAATERTLRQLASSQDFAQATAFRSAVAQIGAIKSPTAKVAKYFSLIGIDSRDSRAVADFVGARDVRAQWLSSLERTTALSSAQADTVARSLQTALRGSLQ